MAKQDRITISPTQYIEYLRLVYKYDPQTGQLSTHADGKPFGRQDANGVIVGTFMGKTHTIAKFVWLHQHGTEPKGQVRLIDPDLPPTIDNLYDTKASGKAKLTKARLAPHTVYQQSQLPKSGVRGITWQSTHNSWRVIVKGVYYGSFKKLDEAKKRYTEVTTELIETAAERKRKASMGSLMMRQSEHPSAAELEEMFVYDPETGYIHERKPGRRCQPYAWAKGNPLSAPRAGTYYGSNHPYTHINGRKYYIAQIVWALHHGEIPETYRTLNGNPQDTRIANITDKPVSKDEFPFARTYNQPESRKVQDEQPKPEPVEEVNEYEYMGRTFVKQPDGRFSFYSRSYDETKCGTLEELEAFVDAVERGDIMGSIAKWGELASAGEGA